MVEESKRTTLVDPLNLAFFEQHNIGGGHLAYF